MIALIGWFLTPIGRIVGMGLAAAIALGGLYYTIRNDGVQAERAKTQQENQSAINEARKAGDDAGDKFDRNPAGGVPNDQYRD